MWTMPARFKCAGGADHDWPYTPHCFIFDRDTEFIAENVSSADKKVIVTVDGGEDLRIDPGERVTVRRADAYVRLLAFDGEYFTRKMLRKLKI